ncbi:MAG: sigma-70 family RNA polymerase sigma factor [Polyangiaceae bacterium]|nr:sigma-70 family RNA polymerase sigma factor [Polyangiaceae bacterium]
MAALSSNLIPLRPERPHTPKVVELPVPLSDAAIVAGVCAGQRDAGAALFDRYSPLVHRVLLRVLGPDPDVHDLLQDVFVSALGSMRRLENPSALRGWLTQIAVFTARGRIRKRVRWRFLLFSPTEELPEQEAMHPSAEVSEALKKTYAVLNQMPPDERIPFALRFIDGMELTEVAKACGTSLATIKRRLSRAQTRFVELARQDPSLLEWVGEPA